MPHPSMHVGSVEVVPLCDGWRPLPLSSEAPQHDVDWEAERADFPWAFEGADGAHWAWHVHAFLLRTGAGALLIDSGVGHLGRPPYDVAGRIEEELGAVGVSTEDVQHVIHTHLHADHAGGACLPDGRPRFPNAVHHVHPADWAFFAGSSYPEDFQGRTSMVLLEELGMLDLDPDDREITAGVRLLHSPGHTPGHRSVVVTDEPFSMLFTGDLLHLPVQVAHPEWISGHDEEPAVGVTSRVALLARARDERWGVAVSHFGRPFGGVLVTVDGQRWGSA